MHRSESPNDTQKYQPGDPAPGFPATHSEQMSRDAIVARKHDRIHRRTIRWPIGNPGSIRFTF